jgi:hypothetical protein
MPFPFGPIIPVQSNSVVLYDQGFEAAALGNLGTLSSFGAGGLSLTRASAATVQISASQIDSTPTTDQACIGSPGLGWQGLVMHESWINELKDSRDITTANWTAGGGSSTSGFSATAPDGAATVCRYNLASGALGRYYNLATSIKHDSSFWARATSGTNSYQANLGSANLGGSLTTTWQRVNNEVQNGGGFNLFGSARTSEGTNAARDWLVDLCCISRSVSNVITQWPGEAIITSGGTATRAGETLSIGGSNIVSAGQISLELSVYPRAAIGSYNATNQLYLFYVDANNWMRIDTSTSKVTAAIAGGTVTSATAISFAQYDKLEMFAQAGGGGNAYFSYRVNGGATTVLLNTALAGNYASSTTNILSGGAVFSCWLNHLTTYSFTNKPVWA